MLHRELDIILTYDNVSLEDRARLHSLESPEGHREKALYDYTFMLASCFQTGAPYLIMLEDDFLATDDWYGRTKAAIEDLGRRSEHDISIYLRLFYNTRLQGWNFESWPCYLFWSMSFEILLLGILYIFRRYSSLVATFLGF